MRAFFKALLIAFVSVAAATDLAKSPQDYLFDAARAGRTDLVGDLLKAGTPIDATDTSGYTPLILAAYNGRLDTVDALLRAGADPNLGDKRGNTALMGAIFKGEEAIVLRLLEKDPDRRPADAAELIRLLDAVPLVEQWTERRAATWWTHDGPPPRVAL